MFLHHPLQPRRVGDRIALNMNRIVDMHSRLSRLWLLQNPRPLPRIEVSPQPVR